MTNLINNLSRNIPKLRYYGELPHFLQLNILKVRIVFFFRISPFFRNSHDCF